MKCSITLIISKMKTKATVRYHYMSARIKWKRRDTTEGTATGTLENWQYPGKLNICTYRDPAIPLLGRNEYLRAPKFMYRSIWGSTVNNSSQTGNEQNIHVINIWFIYAMEYYTAMRRNHVQIHATKILQTWCTADKPNTREYTLLKSICIISKDRQN